MKEIGVDHCGVADTIGVGTPPQGAGGAGAALKHYPLAEVSGHFHDTYGQALANIHASLQLGIHTFDTSIAGLGGCPYAQGATGNVATEDVVFMLQGMGIATGLDLDALVDAGGWISDLLGRPPVSRAGKALLSKRRWRHDGVSGRFSARRAGAGRARPRARAALAAAAVRTSQEAADALGVAVGQIAKSVIFRRRSDDAAVLV